MANTTIQVKRSGTPGNVPPALGLGELALNYADGLLFYKNVNNFIVSFSGGSNSFGTVNANGTLIVADAISDVLNLVAGSNITFDVDTVTDRITINSAGGGGDVSAPFGAANAAFSAANSAFAKANSALANTSGATFAGDLVITGNVGIGTAISGYKLEVAGSFAAQTKSFVITHPTKPDKKLRYGSLEGPENGVYFRGRSSETVIRLPDYWEGLVDAESVTVHITPMTGTVSPKIRAVNNKKIVLDKPWFGHLDFFFIAYGERKDVPRFDVEF